MVTFVLIIIGIATFLPTILLPTPPSNNSESVVIGDKNPDSSSLTILSSNVSSVDITLIRPGSVTADVYLSSYKPVEISKHLPQNRIPVLTGPSRHYYNYYGGDEPIYLLPNSKLIYIINAIVNNNSTCPLRLYLFDNVTSYVNFKNNKSFTEVESSPCLPKSMAQSHMNMNSNFSFNITKRDLYYVAIEIDTGTNVTSYVSVIRVYYNITGLKRPSECPEYLSADHPSCLITLCSFFCYRGDKYLLVNSYGSVEVFYSFSTPKIYGSAKMTGFIISLLFIVAAIIIVITLPILAYKNKRLIECCKHIFNCQSRTD